MPGKAAVALGLLGAIGLLLHVARKPERAAGGREPWARRKASQD